MILNLTIENLLKSGCNTDEANKLFNTSENYTLQCNNGNFYVSKPDNRFYTGIDFYKMIYFNIEGLRFPYNCPDLVNEYFGLALIEFLEKQKTILGLLFNEKDQFNKFISIEIERTQKRIDSQKEFLLKMKLHKFENKENDIKICESYINYLKVKQQPEAVKPKKNDFKGFFNNNVSTEVIEKIQDEFKEYYGKKMAMLIYLLETEFKLITYSLDSKTDGRKHFVDSLNKSKPNMQPINRCFFSYAYGLDITHFEKDKDFVRIKEKLQETIN
ncbi:hypothetical protein K5L04_02265 [Flavobacterium psychrophilum]|uniref:hypothetical protein n=1 Tax=Flavobacterium psychrophilum TaxID=96345 RepID=UPI001C8F6549|nr:hypothetical protein [Flavobacterium psychrophilum]QZL00943.1 hypothetical protein K5L04_02265 [Flavobacterium psychrophilum]